MSDNQKEVVVPEDDTEVDSFSVYPSSNTDETKLVDGEKHLADFHMYKEGDPEDDDNNDDEEE